MPFIVFLMLIGAGVGFAASAYMRLGVQRHVAILAGAFGGLIGGMALKLLLSGVGSLIGAIVGAVLLLLVAQAITKR